SAFMQGGSLTMGGTSQASVINNGDIVSQRGNVMLIARDVASTGSIGAPAGTAALVAAQQVVLMESRPGNAISVEVPGGDVTANGAIKAASVRLNAAGGNIYALAGNNGGLIEATGTANREGRVWLSAGGDVTVQGTVAATGKVGVRAGGTAAVSGKIAASGTSGVGGLIDINAGKVILSGATLNASGTTKGGTIALGGVKDSAKAAGTVVVDAASTLLANGGDAGNGGSVSLWSTLLTDFGGTIQARGGSIGVGGSAEVSSAGDLGFAGTVKLDGGAGLGRLLLDPGLVFIEAGGTTTYSNTASFLDPVALVKVLASADLTVAAGGGGLTVFAPVSWSTAGKLTLSSRGNLVQQAALTQSAPIGTVGGITLIADGAIYVRSNIVGTGGLVNVVVNSSATGSGGGIVVSDLRPVSIVTTGNVALGGGTALDGSGYAYGNGASFNGIGITLKNATTIAAGGAVTLRGRGGSNAANPDYGISVFNGTIVGGSVTLDGISGSASASAFGVVLGNYGFLNALFAGATHTVTVRATTGDLVVTGEATPTVAGSNSKPGISVNTNATLTADNGSIALRGTNSSSGSGAVGGITFGAGDTISAGTSIEVWGSAIAGSPVAIALDGTLRTTGTFGGIGIYGDRISLGGTIVTPGSVVIQAVDSAWDINVGSAVKTTARTLELSSAEVQAISAGALTIGAMAAGTLTVSAPVALTTVGNLELIAGGQIVQSAPLSLTIPAANTGTIAMVAGRDIFIGANLTGAGGTVDVLANANALGSGGGITVGSMNGTPSEIAAGTATLTAAPVTLSTTGDIVLGGGTLADGSGYAVGLNSFAQIGVAILTGASVVAGGTVAMRGLGGPGPFSYGIDLFAGTISGGSVTLAGTLTAGGGNGIGVFIGDYGFIEAIGAPTSTSVTATAGDITIVGDARVASNTAAYNAGVFLYQNTSLNAPNGSIQIRGTVGPSGTVGGTGIWEWSTARITAGRTIGLWGLSTAPTPLSIYLTGSQTVTNAGGEIDLAGDFILMNGPVSAASGTVSIQPVTPGRAIAVGASSYINAGTLSLVTADLGFITAETLTIGSPSVGGLTVAGPVAFSTVGNLHLIGGSTLTMGAPLSLAIPAGTSGEIDLIAQDDIYISSNIVGTGGTVSLLVNSDASGLGGGITMGAFNSAPNAIPALVTGNPIYTGGTALISMGGSVTLGGGADGTGIGYAIGNNSFAQMGIALIRGATIVAGGAVSIRGAAIAGPVQYGIDMIGAGVTASSVTMVGIGDAAGIVVGDQATTSRILATSGYVSMFGAPMETGNVGVLVTGAGTIAAPNGSVFIQANGPTAIDLLPSSVITASGVILLSGSSPFTSGLALNLSGTLGQAGITSNIELFGDRIAIGGPIAATNQVLIRPTTAGWDVNLGSVVKTTGNQLELSSAELQSIVTGTLTIAAPSGNLYETAPIALTHAGNLELAAGGSIVVGKSLSLIVPAANSGHIDLVAGRNIDILASVIGGGGTVSILANANADSSSGGGGIVVGGFAGGPLELAASTIGNQTGASVLLSATGDIALGGGTLGDGSGFALGLTGFGNMGIATLAGVTIAAAGTVTLRGQGAPNGGYPFGIDIANGTITGKSIFIDGLAGTGSGAGAGIQVTDANFIPVVAGAVARTTLTATGGDLTIVGAAPTSGPFQPGLLIANGSTLSAPNGSVRLNGTGGAGSAGNVGVATGVATAISAGQTIAITGTTGAPGTLAINLGGPLTASGTGGEIDLIGDRIAIGGPIVATGLVSIQPWTPGWHVDIGSTAKNSQATLELLPAEIGSITAGTLSLGSSLSGDLALTSPIVLTHVGNVTFETRGDLTQFAALGLAIPVGHVGTIGLIAGGDIFIRSNIVGSGGTVDLLANSNKTGGGGGITIGGFTGSTTAQADGGGETYTNIPTTINLTGNATLGGGLAGDGSGYAVGRHSIWKMGIVMTPAVTLSAGGVVTLRGEASGAATYGYGIEMQQNDTIVGSSVSLFGRSPASAIVPHGLNIGDGAGISVIRATAGDVLLVGDQTGLSSVNPASIGAVFGPQATVVATNGAIDLSGTGATGIFTYSGSTLTAVGGVALTGSQTANGSMGLSLAGSIVSIGQEGASVALTADAMALSGTIVSSGKVAIQPLSGAVGIDLGTTDKTAVDTLQLSAAELARIAAAGLAIGSATSGAMTISAPIALTAVGNLTLETGSVLHVNAPLSLTIPAGRIGTMSLIAWNDIFIDGNISGGGGTVNLVVNANTSGDGGGIEVARAGAPVNIGVTGGLMFGGGVAGDANGFAVGLNTTNKAGIYLGTGATVVADGFAQFCGQGGSGSYAHGVDVFNASVTAGAISIHGLVDPTIAVPIGVMISDGVGNASLTAVSGDITLIGGPSVVGGTPPSFGAGVWFNSTSTVTAPNGSVMVAGNGAVGVNIVSSAATISAGATIAVHGTAAAPTGLGIAMGGMLVGLGTATEVDLIGDRIAIGGTIVNPGLVAIETIGSLTSIDLGSTGKTAANKLELSANELARIQAGTLGILTGGTISLSADLNTVPNIGTLGLQANGGIVQTAGSISANGLALYGASVQLANPNNAIGTVAALAGAAIDIAVSGPLTVGTVLSLSGVSTNGPVTLEASGAVTLNASVVSASAVGDAAIISGSVLVNQIGGASISTPAGRWLVFTPSAGAIVANGLVGIDWLGTSLASYRSGAAVGAGNRFVIATPGTLTVTPDPIFTTYGTTVTPTYSVTGLMPGDSLPAALSGTPILGSPGIAAGVYSIGAAPGSLVSLENYVLAFAPGTATVARAPLTVTAGNVTTTYGQAQNPTVGYSGFQYADNAALLGGALSFSGQGINVGTYAVTPGGLTSSNYAISYVPGTLTVNRAPLTVVTNALTTTYGQAPNPTVGFIGLQYSDSAASFGGGLSFSGQGIDVGTYSVLPSGLTSGNYTVSYVPGTLTVNRAPLTVVTNALTTTYGQVPNLTAGYIGLQYQDTPASLGGVLAFVGQGAGAGTYSVMPNGLTSGNYAISFAPGTLTVNKASLTVVTNTLATTYGQTPNLTAGYTGFQYSDSPASLGGALAFSGQGIDAGTYNVLPSGLTSGNYAISFAPGTLTVN
ncbi:MAG: MBG domain-containing protein, partial [Rhodospirillales bacterium]